MIELKHINKIYNGFNALNDISLTIKDGEICGIIGQSGAGKSTLVRCINMLEPPTSGDVIVNGRNMVTKDPETGSVKGYQALVPKSKVKSFIR